LIKRNETMIWNKFDADFPSEKIESDLDDLYRVFVGRYCYGRDEKACVRDYIKKYDDGGCEILNCVVYMDVFKPSEFDDVSEYDDALSVLLQWFVKNTPEWRRGSDEVAKALRSSFPSDKSRAVGSVRARMKLDGLVTISGKRVAIEVETSTNMDNGIATMRLAIRAGLANCGVLIVPWVPMGPGRAHEGNALGKIDAEFQDKKDLSEGPIYRLAVTRWIDICRRAETKYMKLEVEAIKPA
jgi:hypothetical protein